MVNLGQEITVNILEEIEKAIPYLELEVQKQIALRDKIEGILNDYEITSKRYDLVKGDVAEKAKTFLVCKKWEGASNNTLYNYGLFFNKMNDYFHKPVSMITTIDLRMFIAKTYSECKASTQNAQMSKIKSFFTWLHDEGYINNNPSKNLKEIKAPKRKRGYIKAIDIEKMREQCRDTRDKALLEFLLSTGCRVGECSDSLISEIDWQNNSIKVIGKGDKERTVYFSIKCRYFLMQYIEERQKKGILIDNLFITKRKPYRQLGTRAIQRDIKRMSEDANIGYSVFPHLCRHTFTQNCVDNGMPINITQKLMGHSSSDTTAIYYDISNIDLKNEYRKVAI